MNIIDTCAIINIFNTSHSEKILRVFDEDLCYQGLVEDECVSHSGELDRLASLGIVSKFDGSQITAAEVGDIATRFSIGIGEAECLVIAAKFDYGFISDDNKARKVASKLISKSKITGTIGVLCRCIDSGSLTQAEAEDALANIRAAGGHVPSYDFSARAFRR